MFRGNYYKGATIFRCIMDNPDDANSLMESPPALAVIYTDFDRSPMDRMCYDILQEYPTLRDKGVLNFLNFVSSTSYITLEELYNDSNAMEKIVLSKTAMNIIASSQIATEKMINSQTAMEKVAQTDYAIKSMLASETSLNLIVNSSSAMTAIANSYIAVSNVWLNEEALNVIKK